MYTYDYSTIIKYDSSGNELWTSQYSPVGWQVTTSLLAVDDSGNVYVSNSCGIEKFDSTGTSQWETCFCNNITALTTDSGNNIYATGSCGTAKYDTNGTPLWSAPEDGKAMAIDNSGNIHITGDDGTAMYSPDGTRLWIMPGAGNSLCLDQQGNTFVSSHVVNDDHLDYTTTKFDIDGNPLWSKDHTVYGYIMPEVTERLEVDAFGNSYIYCPLYPLLNEKDNQTLVKYDPMGNEILTFNPAGKNPDIESHYFAMQVDTLGNIYFAGWNLDWNNIPGINFETKKYIQRQPNIYTITATSGPNGSLDWEGPIPVNEQQTFQFIAQPLFEHDPYNGYMVDKWYIDGKACNTIGSMFTLKEINSDHTLHVTFKPNPAFINFNAQLEPCQLFFWCALWDGMEVFQGENKRMWAGNILSESNDGKNYGIDKWYLNGQQVQNQGLSYYLCDIKSDIDLVATVKEVPLEYTFTCTAGPNGSVANSFGALCMATPDTGYVVDKWYSDGEIVQHGGQRYIPDDNQDRNIHVTFKEPSLNYNDFAKLANHWGKTDCWGPEQCPCDCYEIDLNLDRSIDIEDFILFAEYWLEPATPRGIQTALEYNRRVWSVRIAVDRYKMQHLYVLPTSAGLPFALTIKTDVNGALWVDDAISGFGYGPYLDAIPANPFTGGNIVNTAVDWQYSEVTGEFEGAHGFADDDATIELFDFRLGIFLQQIRDAIKSYKYDHHNKYPTAGNADFTQCMTEITDVFGGVWIEGVSTGLKYGPYLRKIDTNPFNGQNTIDVDGVAGDNSHGWYFDPTNGRFCFDDNQTEPDGTPHSSL